MVDYLIVGCGLAGISFAKELLARNKSFVMISDESQRSSEVAGALYNPVILKRFTPVWKAAEQLDKMHSTFSFYEHLFNISLIEEQPVLRKFASIEEQNMWFEAADKPNLSTYMSTALLKNTYDAINAPFKFGEVLHTGRVAIGDLIASFKAYYLNRGMFFSDSFKYDELKALEEGYTYKDIHVGKVIFCEGFGLEQNPYFNYLPLRGTKGQLLVIKAPELQVDKVIKSAGFMIPIGNDLYKIGATYEHTDKNNTPTPEGRAELLDKIKGLIECDFEIVDQLAGVRPTVADRRPLIGEHPAHKNMYILNGLGTRGVMIGPYVADKLIQNIEHQTALDTEIDIKRFKKRWLKANA
ncbi:NAD(P)/FAD-dependent oxidoreductase [Neptunitalea lumnitzerae]|uniref:FAD-dependent oxidoreductase n=1 Tax=Neptunitalea lumnitzerae TaxID=2965509 RepID=A0ABQ5MEG9_9FLAO|nr:FAD-binding oxidoreductase [Neptunitalea sp. Y10]GLB47726.1 FAD-dependent oxidoreductase [Neptunitalea sp. Y10]